MLKTAHENQSKYDKDFTPSTGFNDLSSFNLLG